MRIYFVRHGESELNAKNTHQMSHTKLSEVGKNQAIKAGDKLSKQKVDLVLSSTFIRAQETAKLINERLKLPLEFSPLLVEMKRPTVIEGRGVDDDEVVMIKKAIKDNYHISEYRHSDEETFLDFRLRCEEALEMIKGKKDQNIVVVSHSGTIKLMVSLLCFGKELTPKEFLKIDYFLKMHNTGITVCDYDPERHEAKWRLETWNDLSHLQG